MRNFAHQLPTAIRPRFSPPTHENLGARYDPQMLLIRAPYTGFRGAREVLKIYSRYTDIVVLIHLKSDHWLECIVHRRKAGNRPARLDTPHCGVACHPRSRSASGVHRVHRVHRRGQSRVVVYAVYAVATVYAALRLKDLVAHGA